MCPCQSRWRVNKIRHGQGYGQRVREEKRTGFFMAVWALADLHLAFGVPDKKMDAFGEPWIDYTDKIQKQWLAHIKPDDLVLLAGDISWAMRLEDAAVDLNWIHQLPGTKVMIRGNHDYWWTSLSKVEKILPPSMHIIQNNVFNWKEYTIGGTRLWDSDFSFNDYIEYKENPRAKQMSETPMTFEENDRIYMRELGRLELSLKNLNKDAAVRIAMTHYPPISADLEISAASMILERYKIHTCVFGHLHNLKKDLKLFGNRRGVQYILTSCDYLDFIPKLIYN